MVRGLAELDEILEEIQAKVFLANRMDELDDLLEKWGFTQFIEKKVALDEAPKYGKIVIIGDTELKENIIMAVCKTFGISKDRVELCLSYEQAQKYNFRKMQYNPAYSAILFGPVPHSGAAKGFAGSIIAGVERGGGYPPVVRLSTGTELKITKATLKTALQDMLDKDIIRAA